MAAPTQREEGPAMAVADEIEDQSPIEEVRLTIPTTDDTTLPTLTFRTWVLGLSSCVFLAFVSQILAFRQTLLYISPICLQLLVLPLAKLMAKTLPTKPIRIPFTKWKFSMNPGPFNMKEHALIYTLTSSGYAYPSGLNIVTQMKIFYHHKMNYWITFLVIQTTQFIGYGVAGIFMRFLIDSPHMWFPGVVAQYSLFRALHEKEVRIKGQLTKLQFFVIASVSSFAYYIVPGYLFPSIGALSVMCWIWKDSVTAQIIGSGRHGLGIGSFTLDWTAIAGYLGSPLTYPAFSIVNLMAGFILSTYIGTPIAYWTNWYNTRRFPMISTDVYDKYGQPYNTSQVIKNKNLEFDAKAYANYSNVYLSSRNIFTYGFGFAAAMASLTHVALLDGRMIWRQLKQANKNRTSDVHARLMKNYASIPQWWYYTIFISMTGLAIFCCELYKEQLQLPYWGILLSCGLSLILILPMSVIWATTNQVAPVDFFIQIIAGYLYSGRPLENLISQTYGQVALNQATLFINDFKLCHYMKIPPRSMFLVQVLGTMISTSIKFSIQWYILSSVKNICEPDKLPKGSNWTCPSDRNYFMSNIIWGLVGPSRVFYPSGPYSKLFLFFIVGAISPVLVWMLARSFPHKKWITLINIPLIFVGASTAMPPVTPINYWSWFFVGIIFNHFVYRRYKGWWAKYNYVLSNALDAGCAFMAFLLTGALQSFDVYGISWWGLDVDDHCPLASCPTAPGVVVDGCPVFQ